MSVVHQVCKDRGLVKQMQPFQVVAVDLLNTQTQMLRIDTVYIRCSKKGCLQNFECNVGRLDFWPTLGQTGYL